MNNYYVESGKLASKSGMHNATLPNVVPGSFVRLPSQRTSEERPLPILNHLVSKKALKIVKYSLASLSFLGLLGIVGGFEAGILSLGTGITVAIALIAAEFLCLR